MASLPKLHNSSSFQISQWVEAYGLWDRDFNHKIYIYYILIKIDNDRMGSVLLKYQQK